MVAVGNVTTSTLPLLGLRLRPRLLSRSSQVDTACRVGHLLPDLVHDLQRHTGMNGLPASIHPSSVK